MSERTIRYPSTRAPNKIDSTTMSLGQKCRACGYGYSSPEHKRNNRNDKCSKANQAERARVNAKNNN